MWELLRLQRLGATTLCPRAQGRSLSATLAVHGGACAATAVTPFAQRAKAVWQAVAGTGGPRAWTLPQLRRAWAQVKPMEQRRWAEMPTPPSASWVQRRGAWSGRPSPPSPSSATWGGRWPSPCRARLQWARRPGGATRGGCNANDSQTLRVVMRQSHRVLS